MTHNFFFFPELFTTLAWNYFPFFWSIFGKVFPRFARAKKSLQPSSVLHTAAVVVVFVVVVFVFVVRF